MEPKFCKAFGTFTELYQANLVVDFCPLKILLEDTRPSGKCLGLSAQKALHVKHRHGSHRLPADRKDPKVNKPLVPS